MAKNKTTIGKLIESEVRKQQIPITEFAKLICCQRNNVYDIFKRSKIDIVQLKQISKVLKRNFFKELADDIELISEDDISEKEVLRQKAVSQFFEIVPNILHELGKPSTIVFASWMSQNTKIAQLLILVCLIVLSLLLLVTLLRNGLGKTKCFL